MYYIQNMSQELHGYDRRLLNLKGRHKVNTECIIDALDVYCDTQLEFNEWLMWINDSIDKYQELVWNKDGYKYETKEESINQ